VHPSARALLRAYYGLFIGHFCARPAHVVHNLVDRSGTTRSAS